MNLDLSSLNHTFNLKNGVIVMTKILNYLLIIMLTVSTAFGGYWYGKAEQLSAYVDLATVTADDSHYRTVENPEVVISKPRARQ